VSAAGWLIGLTFAVAASDWVAVLRGDKPAEYVLKPLTIVLLIAAAFALGSNTPAARFDLTIAALVLSLAGDVFLMVPKDLFVAGLASFLCAHLAYVGAFCIGPAPLEHLGPAFSWRPVVIAAPLVFAVAAVLFLRIRRGIMESGHPDLVVPVAVYVLAISAMVVSAFATLGWGSWSGGAPAFAIAGAVLFFVSDSLIGWTRFVKAHRWGPVAIIVTYHLGQIGLVLGLLGGATATR
jgi:uncharacterized membrane protein YhhN